MYRNIRVDDLAAEVLARQARIYAEKSGEPYDAAMRLVLETEAGRQLEELRAGPHRDESARRWHENLQREQAEHRARSRWKEQAAETAPLVASR